MKNSLVDKVYDTPNGPVVTFRWPVTSATDDWLKDLYEHLKDIYENDDGRTEL
jgi:hypothetical protein